MNSTPLDDLKAVLRAAERERNLEQAADLGRVKIRLFERPSVRRRLLVFKSKGQGYPGPRVRPGRDRRALRGARDRPRRLTRSAPPSSRRKALSLTARGSEEDR
jgi:hypothetical protein